MTSAANQPCSFCNQRPALPCLVCTRESGSSPFYCTRCGASHFQLSHPGRPTGLLSDVIAQALSAAYESFKADRESRSSDAMRLAEKAWPLVCRALGKES